MYDLDNYDEFTHEILDITRSCVFEDVKADTESEVNVRSYVVEDIKANTESEVSVSSRLTIAPSQIYTEIDIDNEARNLTG
ncbi:unnamed protein product [Rhizophagus irregularis]|uniref:Uncharacterized protein n=1 Tax=Rhizophagus irregularis TaxID=588596 RepID=A0A915ZM74_9GLOM|nr:unnamed protein product [Rhizophagus irregularis]